MLFLKRIFNLKYSGSKSNKKFFIIASHGQTATMWLASALNQHANIFCEHGYMYPPEGADGKEYSLEEARRREKITAERFWTLSVQDYLKELETGSDKQFLGSVHAFTYGRLADLMKHLSKSYASRLTVFNMVRHPITRLTSTYKCWINEDDPNAIVPFVEKDFATRCDHLIDFISKRHQIEFTPHNKTFVATLLVMEDITKDMVLAKKNRVFNICFEKVIQDKPYFSDVVNQIVGKSLDEDAVNDLFKMKKMNKHNRQIEQTPEEQFNLLAPWQKDAVKFIVDRHDMRNVYAEFGYVFPC